MTTDDPADLVLGLDSSTSAAKAIVWDGRGRALAEGRAPITLHALGRGGYEQDALRWWDAAGQALRQACGAIEPQRLRGLCIAHQRETFVVTDGQGRPLRPAIVWMDERCQPQVERVASSSEADRIHRLSGKPVCATPSLYKLLWLREAEPALLAGDVRVLDVHAFLVHRLTGRFLTSPASADPMGLVDLANGCWAPRLLALAGLSEAQLPGLRPAGTRLGAVTPEAAEACGLPPGLPVIAGAGDGQAAALGAGIAGAGRAYLNLGTAVVAGVVADEPSTHLAFRTLTGAAPGTFLLESDLKGGTFTVDWLLQRWLGGGSLAAPDDGGDGSGAGEGASSPAADRQATGHHGREGAPPAPEDRGAAASAAAAAAAAGHAARRRALLARLEEEARLLPPGAEGLVLVPYWCGVMNPYWDDAASGLVLGWRGCHGPAHLYRALLEGIAFEQRLALSGIERAAGRTIEEVVVLGGGADSALWCQILADVLQKRICRAGSREATSLGAAALAAWGTGLFPDLPAAGRSMTTLGEAFVPGPDRERYARLYDEVYQPLYPSVRPLMARLSRLGACG